MPSGLHFSQWIDSMNLHQASSEILLASYPPPNMLISISFLWSTADIGPRPTQFLFCVCVFACFLLNPYDRISVLSIHLTQIYTIIATVIINNIHIYIYIYYITIILYWYNIFHHLNSNTSISSAFLLPPAARWRGWPQRPGRESPRAVGSPSAPPSPAEVVNVL